MSYSTSTGTTIAANSMLGALKEKAQLAVLYFSDIEKSIVKATNRDLVVPKAKHVSSISQSLILVLISATFERSINLVDMFKQLDARVHENNWIVSFKALICLHYLLSQGNHERVVGYLSTHPNTLNMSGYRDTSSGGQGMEQAKNIKAYAAYLEEKVASWRDLNKDFCKPDENSLQKMTWEKGLPKGLEVVQRQIRTLLESKFFLDSINNEVTTEALRLLVKDLMRLFQVMNEGVINVLQQFFELKKADAQKALELYKNFADQTDRVKEFFDMARKLQNGLGIQIPEIKHAPLSLFKTLQSYIQAPDFEQQRELYLQKKGSGRNELPSSTKNDRALVDVFAAQSGDSALIRGNSALLASNQPAAVQSNIAVMQNQSSFFQQQQQQQQANSSVTDLFGFNQPVQQQQTPALQQQSSQMSVVGNMLDFSPYQMQQGSYSQPTLPSQQSQMNQFFNAQQQQQSFQQQQQHSQIMRNASHQGFQPMQQPSMQQQNFQLVSQQHQMVRNTSQQSFQPVNQQPLFNYGPGQPQQQQQQMPFQQPQKPNVMNPYQQQQVPQQQPYQQAPSWF